MYSDENIFDYAYLLLKSNVGQRHIKKMIIGRKTPGRCPNNFKYLFEKNAIKILPFWDEKYPPFLKEISDFPVFLFLKGDVSLLEKNFVTVVGSRKISNYSIKVLNEIFSKKRKFSKNICFVSGLANGVDSELHRNCLKRNLATIGVVAGGMDRVYYRGNSLMYQYLCKYRLVISEFPPGRKFFKGMFPLRNRIIAGMSRKTFVIQAGKKSGAINTASHANNYGRDVFVIPNNIFDEENQGSLELIAQGAGIIKNVDVFFRLIV